MTDTVIACICFGASAVAILWIALRKPHYPETHSATEQPDPIELCMVRTCHNLWQRDINGWRLCHKHYATSGANQQESA